MDLDLPQYVVLVPVKSPEIGKSRLTGVTSAQRRALAEAFARDTVDTCIAASRVREVLVVTADAPFAARLRSCGAHTARDASEGDLNGALRQAAVVAQRRWPHLQPCALVADLPALPSADLDRLLARINSLPAFVPDAAGSGTTFYTSTHDRFDPQFGLGSRDAHLASGAREIADAPWSVRRDVDEPDDLCEALALGVGRRTSKLTSHLSGQPITPSAQGMPSTVRARSLSA